MTLRLLRQTPNYMIIVNILFLPPTKSVNPVLVILEHSKGIL
jgi:hypothetical protein